MTNKSSVDYPFIKQNTRKNGISSNKKSFYLNFLLDKRAHLTVFFANSLTTVFLANGFVFFLFLLPNAKQGFASLVRLP